jgi:HD-GYP domain-containing protein (c-di-GMP phosphodiesterase class II)
VRVCDVYDALRSATPSRPAMTQDEALAELERGAGAAWEAGAARGLVEMMRGR